MQKGVPVLHDSVIALIINSLQPGTCNRGMESMLVEVLLLGAVGEMDLGQNFRAREGGKSYN
jgi:hypothetical protein